MTETFYNTDAETGVLSILLKSPEAIFEVPNLKAFMFSSSPNTIIYSTMMDLASNNCVGEYNLLVNKLETEDKIKLAGGIDYLVFLKDQDYSRKNIKEFEKIVINSYKARSITALTSNISNKLQSTGDVDSVISSLVNSINSLSESSGGEDTAVIGDVLKDSWTEILSRLDKPGIRGSETGFASIDAVTGGISKGDLWIIASRPSIGKSAYLCNSVLGLAKVGKSSLVFELEMNKQSVVERLLSIETGVPISDVRLGTLSQDSIDKISTAIKKFKDYKIYIDCNFGMDLSYVIGTIRKYHKLHGIDVVYLDYIQLLSERGADQTAELGRISRELKLLANDLGIGIVILSQLNRSVETRDDKHPNLSDLRQSGNLEEDADLVAFLYRDEYYYPDSKLKGVMEFIIRKQRAGGIGSLNLKFENTTNKIND